MRSERPLVYGYLCMEEPDETQSTGWRRDIAVFCAATGYQLGSMFVDRSVPANSFARSGLFALLDALRLPEAHAVVMPTLTQLSTEEFVREALVRMVQLTNSRVLVANVVNGTSAEIDLDTATGTGS